MDQWTRYLFESHPEEILRSWAKRLRMFRFFRAHGGHANDADSLDVAFRYSSPEELEAFFSFLGMGMVRFAEKPQQPEQGVSYLGSEYEKFPSLIDGTSWIQQPGHRELAGEKVFIWCETGKITLSVGLNYEVTEEDVQSAEAIEKIIASCPLERIDPPRDTKNYICPKYYPAYFG
ncbi:hypothetical protein KSF73_16075 [Burkholderiaceae bacterium DAT-1]|nr:hypothetical protein [Burkholderiaceae bacterium DAT-1]